MRWLLATALMSAAVPAAAQEPPELHVTLADGPRGLGVGVAVGEPTGLSLGWRPDRRRAVMAHASWSLLESRFRVGAEYLQHLAVIKPDPTPGVDWPLYVGVGGAIGVDYEAHVGVRVPLGIAALPTKVPVDATLQITPTLWLLPYTQVDLEGTLAVRAWF